MVRLAAIIGLGNIGFKFSYDAKRSGTWSHVDAYKKCPSTELVAAVEIDQRTIDLFHSQYPDIPVYSSVDELFSEQKIDIVSLCVPTKLHFPVFSEVCQHPVKAIFCEKPLSLCAKDSGKMVTIAKEKGILLAVNYTRRWQNTYLLAKELIDNGKIGKITGITGYYPGQIYNIGSHLLDTVRMISDFTPRYASALIVNNNIDPSVSGWLQSQDNVFLSIIATGKHEDLIFELDIMGEEGRIRILENGSVVEYYQFQESKNYSTYRELVSIPVKTPSPNDRFTDAIQNIIDVIEGSTASVRCSGTDGLYVDIMINAILESAKMKQVITITESDFS